MKSNKSQNQAVAKAIQLLGGATKLAIELRLSPSNIQVWLNNTRPVPIQHCPLIEKLTSGAVTRKDLRPNDWQKIWPELADIHAGANSDEACDE